MSPGRVFGVWLLLAMLMSANGVFREVVLVPRVGATAAGVLSAALGIAIILGVTRPFLRPFAARPTARPGRVALAWLVLTVAFEFVVGHWVDGKSWRTLLENYALWRGHLWPIVLAAVVAAPFLWTRGAPPRASRRPAAAA